MGSRSTEEELLFIESLINENSSVVNSKQCDEQSRKAKKRVWENITEEFNNVPQFKKKSVIQLQKCWENLKRRRKMSKWKTACFDINCDAPLDSTTEDYIKIEKSYIDGDLIPEVAHEAVYKYNMSQNIIPQKEEYNPTHLIIEVDVADPSVMDSPESPSSSSSSNYPPVSSTTSSPYTPTSSTKSTPCSLDSSTRFTSQSKKKVSGYQSPESSLKENFQEGKSLIELKKEYYKALLILTQQETDLKKVEHNWKRKKFKLELQFMKENNELERKQKAEKHKLEMKKLGQI